MSVTVVTTLHEDGYNLYGQDNIATWSAYFPADWKITYYGEKHTPDFGSRVNVIDFNQNCPAWDNFYNTVQAKFKEEKEPDEKRKNWYKKALRWSFKMYALLHAMKHCGTRYLIWMDADVWANKAPDANWLEQCLNGTSLAAQLEFIKAGGHIETGILIFDLEHPDTGAIYDWIVDGYVNYKILDEEKAWDGIWLAKLLQKNTVSWNNLDMVIKGNVATAFSNPKLKWLVHGVGKRKFKKSSLNERSGRSDGQELI